MRILAGFLQIGKMSWIFSDRKNELDASVFRLLLTCVTGSGTDADGSASLPVLAGGGFDLAFITQPFLEDFFVRKIGTYIQKDS